MSAPKIVHAVGGQWQELYGHDCATPEEADRYVAALAPNGGMFVVRDGVELPPCPTPEPLPPLFKTPMSELTPEQQGRRIEMVDRVLEMLRRPL